MHCKFQAATSHFFFSSISGIGEKLLLTKATPIMMTLLNLLIIHWSLSKYMTQEQGCMF